MKIIIIIFTLNVLFSVAFANQDYTQVVIDNIYAEVDENNDGEIDVSEANHFAYSDGNYIKNNDRKEIFVKSLTKENLWKLWKLSDVYNWSNDIVILWLQYEVCLPQYASSFRMSSVNGTYFPRLAMSDFSYLKTVLKIQNSSHCQKIASKAKNIILFGPSKDFVTRFPPKDLLSYMIISNLHSQLDDDKDGGVDPSEADEFVRDELKYTSDFDRAKTFNKHDNHISKEELWRNWKTSGVYNWTVADVTYWLCNHVELCEYSNNFQIHNVDGSMVPRLAQSDMAYLFKDLKIKNPVHRKKIIIKATDLILFGPPKVYYSRTKDSILITLLIITMGGCWLAYSQHKVSKLQIQNLQQQMGQLSNAENSYKDLQKQLDRAEKRNTEFSIEKQEIENRLRTELQKTKDDLNRVNSSDDLKSSHSMCSDPNHNNTNNDSNSQFTQDQLKLLLQITYEVEGNFFELKRLAVIKQMEATKDMCEKIRKKRSAIMGSIRIAHSNYFEDMERQLAESKNSIDQIKSDLLERSERWKKIEQLTNFKLLPTPGLINLRTELNNAHLETGGASSGPQPSINASNIALTNNIALNNNKEHPLLKSTIRPSSLFLYQPSDTQPSESVKLFQPATTLENPNSNTNNKSMQKIWSYSNNLNHLCTSISPCCVYHDPSTMLYSTGVTGTHTTTSSSSLAPAQASIPTPLSSVSLLLKKNDVNSTLIPNLLGSNTGVSSNKKINDKVRPFAFRWLKKSKK